MIWRQQQQAPGRSFESFQAANERWGLLPVDIRNTIDNAKGKDRSLEITTPSNEPNREPESSATLKKPVQPEKKKRRLDSSDIHQDLPASRRSSKESGQGRETAAQDFQEEAGATYKDSASFANQPKAQNEKVQPALKAGSSKEGQVDKQATQPAQQGVTTKSKAVIIIDDEEDPHAHTSDDDGKKAVQKTEKDDESPPEAKHNVTSAADLVNIPDASTILKIPFLWQSLQASNDAMFYSLSLAMTESDKSIDERKEIFKPVQERYLKKCDAWNRLAGFAAVDCNHQCQKFDQECRAAISKLHSQEVKSERQNHATTSSATEDRPIKEQADENGRAKKKIYAIKHSSNCR